MIKKPIAATLGEGKFLLENNFAPAVFLIVKSIRMGKRGPNCSAGDLDFTYLEEECKSPVPLYSTLDIQLVIF